MQSIRNSYIFTNVVAKDPESSVTLDTYYYYKANSETDVKQLPENTTKTPTTRTGSNYHQYMGEGYFPKMNDGEYIDLYFSVMAVDGMTENQYIIRVYPMNLDNRNLEKDLYPDETSAGQVSIWVAEVGELGTEEYRLPNAVYSAADTIANGNIPTYYVEIGDNNVAADIKVHTENKHAGVRIEDSGYKEYEQIITYTGLEPNARKQLKIYVKSQNELYDNNNRTNGELYLLNIIPVPADRRIIRADVVKGEAALFEEQQEFYVVSMSEDVDDDVKGINESTQEIYLSKINTSTQRVPVTLTAKADKALITVTGDLADGEGVTDNGDGTKSFTGTHIVEKLILNYTEAEEKHFTVTVKNRAADPEPRTYDLILSRKTNNLELEYIKVNSREASYNGTDATSGYPIYSIDLFSTDLLLDIEAKTIKSTSYVNTTTYGAMIIGEDLATAQADTTRYKDSTSPYTTGAYTEHTAQYTFDTVASDGSNYIPLNGDLYYLVYVGSDNVIDGIPDEINKVILKLHRLAADEIPSDLKVRIFANHNPDEVGKEANPLSAGLMTEPTQYEVLINQNAEYAYVNVLNNFSTTTLKAYYPMDTLIFNTSTNEYELTGVTEYAMGSLRMGPFQVPMGTDVLVPVLITATTAGGQQKQYVLNIRRESNDASLLSATALDILTHDSPSSYLTVGGVQVTRDGLFESVDTDGVRHWSIDLPVGTTVNKVQLTANSPFASIEMLTIGGYLPNSSTDKHIVTTQEIDMNNKPNETIKFRIVPSSVYYNANGTQRTTAFDPEDGCTYYEVTLNNIPYGTGIEEIFVEYVNSDNMGFKASIDSNTGFLSAVPADKTQTNVYIKTVTANSDIIFKDKNGTEYPVTRLGDFELVVNDYQLSGDMTPTPAYITVKAPGSNVTADYELIINKQAPADIGLIFKINHTIDAPYNNDMTAYVTEKSLSAAHASAYVTAAFDDPVKFLDMGYTIVIGNQTSTNPGTLMTSTGSTLENNSVAVNPVVLLTGAITRVPVSIMHGGSVYRTAELIISREAVDGYLKSLTVEKRTPDSGPNASDGSKTYYAKVYNKTRTASVIIEAFSSISPIILERVVGDNTDAREQAWTSTGRLNAGVTQLKDGANEFVFTIYKPNSSQYGRYYLTIDYVDLDIALDQLITNVDVLADPLPYENKTFKSNILDYEVDVSKPALTKLNGGTDPGSPTLYTITGRALQAYNDVQSLTSPSPLYMYIGYYTDIPDLMSKAQVAAHEVTPTNYGYSETFTTADLNMMDGYAEVPINIIYEDYIREYVVKIHEKSDDASLVNLGVTGYELEMIPTFDATKNADPGTDPDNIDPLFSQRYNLSVDSDVEYAEIYAIATHQHTSKPTTATTILTLKRGSVEEVLMGKAQIEAAKLNEMATTVKLTPGTNVFTVIVESEDSTTLNYYEITIDRSQKELALDYLRIGDSSNNNQESAQYNSGSYFAYVENGKAFTINAQATTPKHVTTEIFEVIGGVATSITGATKSEHIYNSSTGTYTIYDAKAPGTMGTDTRTYLIRLTDDAADAGTSVREYTLELMNPNNGIYKIMLGTAAGDFTGASNPGYDIPITAKWDPDRPNTQGTTGQYVVRIPAEMHTARIRTITVGEGKVLRYGADVPQFPDMLTDTTTDPYNNRRFTTNSVVDLDYVLASDGGIVTIGLTDKVEGAMLSDYNTLTDANQYDLVIERMSNEAELLSAVYNLVDNGVTEAVNRDNFTVDLPSKRRFSITVPYTVDKMIFKAFTPLASPIVNEYGTITDMNAIDGIDFTDTATATMTVSNNLGSKSVELKDASTTSATTTDRPIVDLETGRNTITIYVTSEDRTVQKAYVINVTREEYPVTAKLNDIIVKVGDVTIDGTQYPLEKYYDTVMVPNGEYARNRITYRVSLPRDLDETEMPLSIIAVPPTHDGLNYTIKHQINNDPTVDGATVLIGGPDSASSPADLKRSIGAKEVVEVKFTVYLAGMNATEYVVQLVKDNDIGPNPELAYLNAFFRSDTGTQFTRRYDFYQYDYNYYMSVPETTHWLTLGLNKNLAIDGYDVYLVNHNGKEIEKGSPESIINNLNEIEIIPEKGDNLFVFEVSKPDGSALESARYYSVIINRAAGVTKDNTSSGSVTVTDADKMNHDAYLELLQSDTNGQLTKLFKRDEFEYFLAVPWYVDALDLVAKAENPAADLRIRKKGGEYLEYHYNGSFSTGTNTIPLREGENMIVITVTAPDGLTKTRYVIDAHRATPTLTGDIINMGFTDTFTNGTDNGIDITPLWDAKLTNYFLSYPNAINTSDNNVTFTPTLRPEELIEPFDPLNPTATRRKSYIYVTDTATNGSAVKLESGQPYTILNLPEGDTTILFRVKIWNGTEKHYAVTVNRAYNDDRPYLEYPIVAYPTNAAIAGTEFKLQRDYYSTENAYYLNVEDSVSEIYLQATAGSATDTARALDTIEINNYTVTSGILTQYPLSYGDNEFKISVSNTKGTTEYYTLIVNRSLNHTDVTDSTNPNTKSLIPYETSSANKLKLDDLVVDGHALIPSYNDTRYDYLVVVDENDTTIDMTPYFTDLLNPTDTDVAMKVTINNMPILSGQKLSAAEAAYMDYGNQDYIDYGNDTDPPLNLTSLKKGNNYFDIVLTSMQEYRDSDGNIFSVESPTRMHYVVNVIRPTSPMVKLDYLGTDKGSMSSVFDPSVQNYYVSIPYGVDTLTIDADTFVISNTSLVSVNPYVTASSATSTVTVNAAAHTTSAIGLDTTSHDEIVVTNIPTTDDSVIIFMVYANPGAPYPTSAYSLTINRHDANKTESIDLKAITVTATSAAAGSTPTPITLTTDFAPRDVNYYAYIPNDTATVDITAIPEVTGMTVTGGGTVAITRDVQTVILTSGNSGLAKQRYSITFIKENTDAKLTQFDYDTLATPVAAGISTTGQYSETYEYPQSYDPTSATPYSFKMDLASLSDTDVIRVNGRRITKANDTDNFGDIVKSITTEREKYDVRIMTSNGKGYVYTLFANEYKDPANDNDFFEPIINEILVKEVNADGTLGVDGTFDKVVTADGKEHVLNVLVDKSEIALFAKSLLSVSTGGTDDPDVTLEMFDKDINDYVLVSPSGYIKQTLDATTKSGTFRFRATKFADSGYENISEYIVNVFNSQDPVATDIKVEKDRTGAVGDEIRAYMAGTYNSGTKDYYVYLNNDATEFNVWAETFTTFNVQIARADDTGWNSADQTLSTVMRHAHEHEETIHSPLTENKFDVLVRMSYTKAGETTERESIYTLHVIRSPYPESDIYLANLDVTEEDDADNGQYERDIDFNKLIRLYNTTIDYRDRTVSLFIEREQPGDVVTAKMLGTTTSTVVMGADNDPHEFILPLSFITNDNSTQEIEFTVERMVSGVKKTGKYKMTIHRGERPETDTTLTLQPRLRDLVVNEDTTAPALTPPFVYPHADSDYFYEVDVDPSDTDILLKTEPNTDADTVIVRHFVTLSASGVTNTDVISGNMVTEIDNEGRFELNTDEDYDIFFITASNSAYPETSPFTYVLKVNRKNNAQFQDLKVTNAPVIPPALTYTYYEMKPVYSADKTMYEVHVPVLAQEIEFTATAISSDPGVVISAKKDGVALGTGNVDTITWNVTTGPDELVTNTRLNLDKELETFEFTIQNSYGGTGVYRVKVIRDLPVSVPYLKTVLKGNVVTVAKTEEADVYLYDTADYEADRKTATIVQQTTADSAGKFDIDVAAEGTYTLVVHRDGYLNYYIKYIKVQKTYADAEYNFGTLNLIPGNTYAKGDSYDKIDDDDLVWFNKIKNKGSVSEADLVETTGGVGTSSILMNPLMIPEEVQQIPTDKEIEILPTDKDTEVLPTEDAEKTALDTETTDKTETDAETGDTKTPAKTDADKNTDTTPADTAADNTADKPADTTGTESIDSTADKSDNITDTDTTDDTADKPADTTDTDTTADEADKPADTADTDTADSSADKPADTDNTETGKDTDKPSADTETGDTKTPAAGASDTTDKLDAAATSGTDSASTGSDSSASSSSDSGSTSASASSGSDSGSSSSSASSSSDSGSSSSSASSSSDSGSSSSASSSSGSDGGSSSSASSSSGSDGGSSSGSMVLGAYDENTEDDNDTSAEATESDEATTEIITAGDEEQTDESGTDEEVEITVTESETEQTETEESGNEVNDNNEPEGDEEETSVGYGEIIIPISGQKITSQPVAAPLLTVLSTTPTILSTGTVTRFADFNADNKVNTKDILYVSKNHGKVAPVLNNFTGTNRVTVSPLTP